MPPSPWTPARDAQLRRLRAEGQTWDRIAADLAVTRWTAIERGRRINAVRPPPEHIPPDPLQDPARDPLPPGHPRTWAPLLRGSPIDGAAYPHPVFSH